MEEGHELEGIFFTTPDMQTSMKAWGETVFFDGTYKLIVNNYVLVLFVVQDCKFLTELCAVAIVKREDQATYDWIFKCFKQHHKNSENKIKYFMSDKNVTQRISAKRFYPDTTLLICLFDTQQIFKRELQKMPISNKEKEMNYELLKKMAYSVDDYQYKKLFEEMLETSPTCVIEYFLNNWHSIKNEWTCYSQLKHTFYNRTNNRCESLNQKLKKDVGKLNSLFDMLYRFFVWKEFHDDQNRQKIVKNIYCQSFQNVNQPLNRNIWTY